MSKVLLTGATGLVGSRLLPRLAQASLECRALVRGDVALPGRTTAVRGDLASADSLERAVEDVDAVVHLAALVQAAKTTRARRQPLTRRASSPPRRCSVTAP